VRLLGAQEVVFLRHDDGTLQPTLELRRELVRVIRHFKPEAVVTGDPTALFEGDEYINHPDHRAAAQSAIDAVLRRRRCLSYGLKMASHIASVMSLSATHKGPNVWVDITSTIEVKIEALRQHKSQMGDWDPAEMIHKWAAETGKERAWPTPNHSVA